MTGADRQHWDGRYAERSRTSSSSGSLADVFAPFEEVFPHHGIALEVACGAGSISVWLGERGLQVTGVDVSPVAIDMATKLATAAGVEHRCRFVVADLDDGLPKGVPANVVVCHRFRDPRLDAAIVDRLVPGGLLAYAALSSVGASPGRFRAEPGELTDAFGHLDVLHHGEGAGVAWMLALRPN